MFPDSPRMPVLFVGHGNPMNAIEDNAFSYGWKEMAKTIPRPDSILCVSAHWETDGIFVTSMDSPRTIHDFGGFPRDLYEADYPAPGDPDLARRVISLIGGNKVRPNLSWGLDHGAWSVLMQMYPEADIPVVQLSLDRSLSPIDHFSLGTMLAPLRRKGILIIGSGNMVHNLYLASVIDAEMNAPYAYPWASEADSIFKDLIKNSDLRKLIDYGSLGKSIELAIPTNEHYLPLLYALASKRSDDDLRFFNDAIVAGSVSMLSFVIG